jgi:subtilisin family serine protease/regulation of enolase protein 1 (concanavalin A-like superfamily)
MVSCLAARTGPRRTAGSFAGIGSTALAWLAGVLLLVLPRASLALEPGVVAPARARPDRIIVRAAPHAPAAALQRLHAGLGTAVSRRFQTLGAEVIALPRGLEAARAVALFRASGLIELAEPDYLLQPLFAPNDFQYQNQDQWNLHNTGIYGGTPGADVMAEAAWDLQREAPDIVVAVVDTGIRYTHEDLAPNMWVNPGESGLDAQGRDKRTNGIDDDGDGYIDDVHGINVLTHSGDPMDDWGHGTHVAGIVGAVGNNGVGVAGIAWRVKLMAVKFIAANATYSVSDAIAALDYARTKGARIVTASWGNYAFNSQALREAFTALRDAGIIVAAAAGNDDNNNDLTPLYPASYEFDNIVAVAATDRTDARAGYSNYGLASVDLGAPGSPVFSTWASSDHAYQYYEGTSMAAPHIAGACALLWARFPGDSYAQIIQRVLANVDPLPALAGRTKTGGRLNLAAALASSAPPPPPSAPAAPGGLSATATSASSIALAWTDNSATETGFEIERSTDGVNFSAAGSVGADVTHATSSGLAAATTYWFRVRAVQGTTASAYSNSANATTLAPPPPPAGAWQSLDIGAVAAAGSGSESSGVFTLRGSGADIWENADEFRFHCQSWSGDGEIGARVTGLTHTSSWAKAGVMFRETLAAGARHALLCLTPGNGTAFQRRDATGGGSSSTPGSAGSAAPRWLRLVRAGSTFTAYESADGVAWTQVGVATLSLPASVYVGLAVTSHNDGTLCTATFDHVSLGGGTTPPPPPPPPPPGGDSWTAADIGAAGLAGSNDATGSPLTVRGAGADIWDTADAFHFAYRTVSGDCTVEARVASLTNTNGWAKAGVMIRESLAAQARNVFACLTPANGVNAQARANPGAATTSQAGAWGTTAPQWVRLVRTGNHITAYQSSDGVAWTAFAATDVAMNAPVYVGLAVTSHDAAQLCTAVFENAAVR